jgi:hypothetical protein
MCVANPDGTTDLISFVFPSIIAICPTSLKIIEK